jgi:ubiquinone/menaquinone biosynthesis C-methylase UbiE
MAIRKFGAIDASSAILHFGPERCLERWFRPRFNGYKTADLSRSDVDLNLDIENIGLASESIDVTVCSHVLEHVDDRRALSELHRVLKASGMLFCNGTARRGLGQNL